MEHRWWIALELNYVLPLPGSTRDVDFERWPKFTPKSETYAIRVVYCDVTERNRIAMSRHRHNVASRHYDGSRRCCYNGVN
jgi:hypothetical protein